MRPDGMSTAIAIGYRVFVGKDQAVFVIDKSRKRKVAHYPY